MGEIERRSSDNRVVCPARKLNNRKITGTSSEKESTTVNPFRETDYQEVYNSIPSQEVTMEAGPPLGLLFWCWECQQQCKRNELLLQYEQEPVPVWHYEQEKDTEMDLHCMDITSITMGYEEKQCHSITIDVCKEVPNEHCGDEPLEKCMDMPSENCKGVISKRVEVMVTAVP